MKRVFVFAILALLLVSCTADPNTQGVGNHISLTNRTEKTIWYQVRKTADPDSGIYKSVGQNGYVLIRTEESEAYTVLFSTVLDEHEEIQGGKLITVTVMAEPTEIALVTSADKNDITFSQTTTGIVWTVGH